MGNIIYKKVDYLTEEHKQDNKERFIELLLSTNRPGMDKLIAYLETTDFFNAPSSTNYHCNYYGGLCEHVLNVYDNLVILDSSKHIGLDEDSMIITALLHDLCKINTYKVEELFTKVEGSSKWVTYYGFKFEDIYGLGHAETSIMIALRYIRLNHMELCMIRWHMGVFNLNPTDMRTYNTARDKYKGVVALHLADMMSSEFDEETIKGKPETINDIE